MLATARSSRPGRSRVATTTLTGGYAGTARPSRSGTPSSGQHEAEGLCTGRPEPVDQPGQLRVAGAVAGDDEQGDAVLGGPHAALVGVRRRCVDHHDALLRLVAEADQADLAGTD